MEVKSSSNSSYFLLFKPRHLEKGETLEKVLLFGAHFSCEWNERLDFKFNIDLEVLFIYRRIPRKPDFLGWLAIFDTTPIGRFWGMLLGAFMAAYNIKMLVSGYQSIDILCISFLKNKQF
jgi:hypothetical protein